MKKGHKRAKELRKRAGLVWAFAHLTHLLKGNMNIIEPVITK